MAKTKRTTQIVVCDAGPLIHLDEVGCLDLLADFSQVLVPEAVWMEVERHRPTALTSPDARLSRVVPATAETAEFQAIARLFALDAGELQALQLVTQVEVDLLLTDDTAARLAASHLGISVHGTIGILVRSIRRGQRRSQQVADLLRSLPTISTLHLSQSLLDEVLQAVERT